MCQRREKTVAPERRARLRYTGRDGQNGNPGYMPVFLKMLKDQAAREASPGVSRVERR